MQVFNKVGDEIIIIYHPREKVEVGENVKILDQSIGRGIIAQVIEENLVDLPGILEDIVRKEALSKCTITDRIPSEMEKYMIDVKNMKFAKAKIRKEIKVTDRGEKLEPWSGWTPARNAEITPLPDDQLMQMLGIAKDLPIPVGATSFSGTDFKISAYELQGITVIVGKKGTGKSHLAKAALLGLIDHGAKALVFDVNDEYSSMVYKPDGKNQAYIRIK